MIAASTRIPRDRLRLVIKGKTYDESETQELIDACAGGKTAMLLGTPAAEQLDRFAGWRGVVRRAKRTVLDVANRPGYWAQRGFGLVWRVFSSTIYVGWLFLKSMFVR